MSAILSRRVRQRRGSANVMRVRSQSMAMAADLERAILAESADWEAKVRADEREKAAREIEHNHAQALLRAKVEGLEIRQPWGSAGTDMIARSDVLALFPNEVDRG